MAPPPPKGTREIAVDGSNVLFGGGTSATPRVKNLELVIKELKKAGWKPVVWVDASRKYDVDDPAKLRAMIATGVVRDIPAGTPADYWVLDHASKHGCKVLSNDQFAVWAEKFPIVGEPDRFMRFMVNGGEASFWGEADRVDRRLPAAREGPKLERWIKPRPARRSRPLKIPSPRTKPEIRPTAPVPVISSIRHTIFFATALAAFWVLFAVGFYVVLNDPYRIFEMLIGFLGRPLAIAVFAFAGLITAEYAANHAVRGLGPGNPRAIVLLATFLTMFLIPAALGALTWYVFPFGTGLFKWVMPTYCAAMAVGAFAAREGFPLVLEPKDRIRMAWEGAFMAAGIGTLVSCVIPVHGLLNKTLETANAVVWLSILIVIGTFLLAKGIGLVREAGAGG